MNARKVDKNTFVRAARHWYGKYAGNPNGVVIGISGGKDSSVAAALFKEAIGPENVLGVMMPNGKQKDLQDSLDLAERLGIRNCIINIGEAYNSIIGHLGAVFCAEDAFYGREVPIERDKNVTTNLPARIRMSVLYAIANHENRRVIGTGNKAEILCGYYTLFGDGACDFDPLADLFVDEVIELGRQLGLPDKFILKTPDDGMSGISDEEKLGFKYSDVKIFYTNPSSVARKILGEETYAKINSRIVASTFKQHLTHIPFIEIDGEIVQIGFY